jgi:inositol phosphorylceramide synthase catalytic subunit
MSAQRLIGFSRAHVRALWGRHAATPFALASAYLMFLIAMDGIRGEHVPLYAGGLALAYASPRTKRFFVAVVPYMLAGIAYDSLRYVVPLAVTEGRVWTCELQRADAALVSLGGLSLPEYFARAHFVALDLFFAIPYAVYAYVVIGYAFFLYFRDRSKMAHFLWAFFIANMMAFTIWLVAPAAPPWYVIDHGCAASLDVAPDPAALGRVDAALGVTYFSEFYSRAASVFGAVPSMHCAFPALGLFVSWRTSPPRFKAVHVAYTAWMAGAAVYLVHHWVIDVVVGIGVAFAATVIARWALQSERAAPEEVVA